MKMKNASCHFVFVLSHRFISIKPEKMKTLAFLFYSILIYFSQNIECGKRVMGQE